MSIKKRYFKTKAHCNVTFRLDKAEAEQAEHVALVGEFNDWQPSATPMQRLKDGSFKANLDLEPGHSYEFRYLVNDSDWVNDAEAEAFVPTPFHDATNSLIRV
jgi:1,4-alpha-glucan branching enzyme